AAALGLDRASLLGRPFLANIVPDDRRRFLAHLRQCRTSEGPVGTDLRLLTPARSAAGAGEGAGASGGGPDPAFRPVHLYSRRAPAPGARGDCFLTAIVDLTERRHAEQTIRRNEERLRFALQAARAGTWEWDLASGAAMWSDDYFHLHGLDPGVDT